MIKNEHFGGSAINLVNIPVYEKNLSQNPLSFGFIYR